MFDLEVAECPDDHLLWCGVSGGTAYYEVVGAVLLVMLLVVEV